MAWETEDVSAQSVRGGSFIAIACSEDTRLLRNDGDVAAAFDDGVFDLFKVFDAALLARRF